MSAGSPPKEFTGRHMLFLMLGFFAIILVANLAMAIAASRSWTGFVVENSYVASQQFNEKMAEAKAQAALGWTSRFDYRDGRVSYGLRKPDGFPVDMASVTVTFRRPASRPVDQTIALSRGGKSDEFAAAVPLHDGIWVIEIDADVGRDKPYRIVRRVIVRNGALL